MLKKIIHVLYSGWVLLLFFITGIPVLLLYFLIYPLPTNVRLRWVYRINYVWLTSWGFLSGIIFQTKGDKKRDPRETYVFISNHCNLFDIVMTGSRIQHAFMPLAKKEVLKVPVMGQLVGMNSVPVDRSSKESRKESFERMVEYIKNKTSILIFPEGTRNRTDKPLKNFYDGGFRLAIATQVPIMPIVLLNIRKLQPVGTFLVSPGKISLNFMDPIPTVGMKMEDVEKLKQTVFDRMQKFILENDVFFREIVPSDVSVS